MDKPQDLMCRLLEQSTDRQDDVLWYEREWDQEKLDIYIVCCLALRHYIDNNREVLARMLRCFCDAEAGEIQYELISACQAYCTDYFNDKAYVSEIVKAAPEMLIKSPIWFGGEYFQRVLNNYDTTKTYFLEALKLLRTTSDQQVIVDFLVYLTEKYPVDKYGEEYNIILADSLDVTGLSSGNSEYFVRYL